jgi:hypothetical protein
LSEKEKEQVWFCGMVIAFVALTFTKPLACFFTNLKKEKIAKSSLTRYSGLWQE